MFPIPEGVQFLCFLWVSVSCAEIFEPDSDRNNVSPLDVKEIPFNVTSSNDTQLVMAQALKEIKAKNDKLLTVKGIRLPDCAKGCTQELFKTMEVAFKSGNNFERFKNVCHRFAETCSCLDKLKHCPSSELFDAVTSGLKYMCIEQERAFSATIDCIDVHASEVKDGCAKDCGADRVLTGWAVYSTLRNAPLITMRMGRIPSKINVVFFRKITTELCSLIECYLSCLRNKYNARCYGTAGSLLSEVLIRPVAAAQDLVLLEPWTNLLKIILPVQCNFLTTPTGLALYRIDQKLEHDLKAAFEKNDSKPSDFSYFVVTPSSKVNEKFEEEEPWKHLAEGKVLSHSPLEEQTYDRNEFWRTSGEAKAKDGIHEEGVAEGNVFANATVPSGEKSYDDNTNQPLLGVFDIFESLFEGRSNSNDEGQ